MLSCSLWLALFVVPTAEQVPPPRPVPEDAFTRHLNRIKAARRPPSPYTEDEERRLGELYVIAGSRQRELELLALLERLRSTRRTPEERRQYGERIEQSRGRLADLDLEELHIRLSGTPLPEIVFPPRP